VTVRIIIFARLREIVGAAERPLTLPSGALVRDAWAALAAEMPALSPLETSTRVARNGRIIATDEPLHDGDEIAFLPPVGGG
jgi:molybdopterin converting factor small subunit